MGVEAKAIVDELEHADISTPDVTRSAKALGKELDDRGAVVLDIGAKNVELGPTGLKLAADGRVSTDAKGLSTTLTTPYPDCPYTSTFRRPE